MSHSKETLERCQPEQSQDDRLICREHSFERNSFAIRISECELLRAGRQGRHRKGEGVHILESSADGFSVDGEFRAGVKAAAAKRDTCASSCWAARWIK